MPFDDKTRNRLARFVADARELIRIEFTEQLQRVYGISATGDITALADLRDLDEEQRALAQLLRQRVDYLRASSNEENPTAAAVDRLTREQAFTVLNRLAAIRMAEKRGFIVESVGHGYQSKGFQVYCQIADSGLGDIYHRYRQYLFCLFDELALDLGALFDRRSPTSLLFPRESALVGLLELVNAPDIDPLWSEDETIGWIYQYYNDEAERKRMREKSAAPRDSRELAVRNQFFTPRYVVEFLTDNTLGRIWYEMTGGKTALKDRCRYLVCRPSEVFLNPGQDPPPEEKTLSVSQEDLLKLTVFTPHRPIKDPREIRMLDPACGSMHFGIYAFDLFEVIYEEAWKYSQDGMLSAPESLTRLHEAYISIEALRRDIPKLIIENNIHGIDIDPRAVQIAGLSVWLRAQKSWKDQNLSLVDRPQIRRSKIVCAEAMPGNPELLKEFSQALRLPILGQFLQKVFEKMLLAGEAGSLLKIEEDITELIHEAKLQWEQGPVTEQALLFPDTAKPIQQDFRYNQTGITDEQFWHTAEKMIYDSLREYAERAEAGYAQRLFANDAARGFAFIDLSRNRYDVVLMNPPFGEPPKATSNYIQEHFPHSSADIFQAFVERGLSRLSDQGSQGVISARTGFFLGSSEGWREHVVFRNRLVSFADLGLGVLDGALVEVALYVIQRGAPKGNRIYTNRQLDNREKGERLLMAVEATSRGEAGGFCQFDQSLIDFIPDHTFAYWAPESLIKRYSEEDSFAAVGGKVRQGIATADDFRFARLAWEVDPAEVGGGRRWQRLSKGGEYSPPYDDIHLLIDWLDNGRQLAESPNARFQNIEYMFRPGATYSARTASAFAAKVLPAGCIFSHMAQSWFNDSLQKTLLDIGYLSTRVPQTFLELAVGSGDIATAGSAARRYTTAVVESVPSSPLRQIEPEGNLTAISSLLEFRRGEFKFDETSSLFSRYRLSKEAESLSRRCVGLNRRRLSQAISTLRESAKLDDAVCNAFDLTREERSFVDQEVGLHPCTYDGNTSTQEVGRLFHLPVDKLVAEAVNRHGARRWFTKKSYFVDRRLELICHYLQVSPSSIEKLLSDLQLDFGLTEFVESTISESLGSAFGRWDIRFITGERSVSDMRDAFAPLPRCSPNMLQNDCGEPLTHGDVDRLEPTGDWRYPIDIPWDGILVDESGHSADIEARVRGVLEVIWPHRAEIIEQEACKILGCTALRDYFRKPTRFFADHLGRYSKSRRQAPIFWPLSTRSCSYTIWLYYPRLTTQTLHTCLADFIEPKLKGISDEVRAIRNSNGKQAKLGDLSEFEDELKEMRAEIERVIKLPYKPDLNDGVLITASPLSKLFRFPKWQKDLKSCWQELERGDYDWSHLAHSMWPHRVREKCRTDRSIAIAHGLEHLCAMEEPKPKARKRRKIEADLVEEDTI